MTRLLKIARTDVRNAVGFFWHDRQKIYVAESMEEADKWKERGFPLRPMCELEQAFKDSTALRFVAWCQKGMIVNQGARRVTFVYSTHKSVMHIK